jgi:hypothetical protein
MIPCLFLVCGTFVVRSISLFSIETEQTVCAQLAVTSSFRTRSWREISEKQLVKPYRQK